jgi:FMN phosphatase YigB (HAD superfamily)
MRTIAWDVDDVLNDLMKNWLENEWLKKHPECGASYATLRSNPPLEETGADKAQYLESLDRFRQGRYATEVAPSEKMLAWFERNGGRFRHLALTAVPLTCASISAAWVMRHFGRWIRCFQFVPSTREGEPIPMMDANKAEFLKWLGKEDAVLVDDSRENVAAAREAGFDAFLFPRPWNGSGERPENILQALELL